MLTRSSGAARINLDEDWFKTRFAVRDSRQDRRRREVEAPRFPCSRRSEPDREAGTHSFQPRQECCLCPPTSCPHPVTSPAPLRTHENDLARDRAESIRRIE